MTTPIQLNLIEQLWLLADDRQEWIHLRPETLLERRSLIRHFLYRHFEVLSGRAVGLSYDPAKVDFVRVNGYLSLLG